MPDPWVKNNRLYGQNFKKLRASSLKSKSLFEDPYFPPEISSLSYSGNVEGDAARLGKGEVGKQENFAGFNCQRSSDSLDFSHKGGDEGL